MTRILLNDFAGHAFTLDLAEALEEAGLDTLYAYCSTNLAPHADFDSATVEVAAVRSGETFDKYRPMQRIASEARYGFGSLKLLRRRRPDTLIANNMPLLSLAVLWAGARMTRTEFVIWLQDIQSGLAAGVLGSGSPLARVARRLERFMLRRGDRVVVISDELAAEIRRLGVPAERIAIMENWPALAALPERPKVNEWSTKNNLGDRPVVLYSGTLAKKHSPELLLRLADELPNVQVVVISEGAGVLWLLHELAKNPRENLLVLPYADFRDLPDVLASADVLIALLNSEASAYSVPSKVLSYLCAGRPIVASMPADNAAARLTAERAEAGLVTAPGDPGEFVTAVQKLLDDPELAATFGRNGRAFAEANYHRHEIARRFIGAAGLPVPAAPVTATAAPVPVAGS
jgi:colanic acid biosynthesis glycosyl transferase WcaI